jgi:hypothetical protein
MTRRIRLYEIYPTGADFSARTYDYHGVGYDVAATSIRQAYFLAGHKTWATDPDAPIGIIQIYTRNGDPEGWWQLWDGCRIHHGLNLPGAASKTAISRAMHRHLKSHV